VARRRSIEPKTRTRKPRIRILIGLFKSIVGSGSLRLQWWTHLHRSPTGLKHATFRTGLVVSRLKSALNDERCITGR
jgi:hypothetical protein